MRKHPEPVVTVLPVRVNIPPPPSRDGYTARRKVEEPGEDPPRAGQGQGRSWMALAGDGHLAGCEAGTVPAGGGLGALPLVSSQTQPHGYTPPHARG